MTLLTWLWKRSNLHQLSACAPLYNAKLYNLTTWTFKSSKQHLYIQYNHTENTLHLLRFKVLKTETCGAVYNGKRILEYWDSCYLHHKGRCKSQNTPKRRHTIRLHDVTPKKTAVFTKYFHYKNQLINAAREMFAASSAKSSCRQTAWAKNSVFNVECGCT